jgi:hypothetical protein
VRGISSVDCETPSVHRQLRLQAIANQIENREKVSEHASTRLNVSTASLLMNVDDVVGGV